MGLQAGQSFGRYRILEPLGEGGMALVYKAYHQRLDRVVALKILRTAFAGDNEFSARFEQEAQAVARLRHPSIVRLYDFDEVNDTAFMAMECLTGGTLKSKLAQVRVAGQTLGTDEVVRIVNGVAAALDHAHDAGIVHRDVKPSNIMFDGAGNAVVTDFGIAKIIGGAGHTQTSVSIGTPEYMSPEQARGLDVDHRADIYALGAVAFELLTGRVPYPALTPVAVALAQVEGPLLRPNSFNAQIGVAAERALLKALAVRKEDRFVRAGAFAEALADALRPTPASATLTTIRPRWVTRTGAITRRAVVSALGGALVVIAAGTLMTANAAGVFGAREGGAGQRESGVLLPKAPQAVASSPAPDATSPVRSVLGFVTRVTPEGNALAAVVNGVPRDPRLRCSYEADGVPIAGEVSVVLLDEGLECAPVLVTDRYAGRSVTVTVRDGVGTIVARGSTVLSRAATGVATPPLDSTAGSPTTSKPTPVAAVPIPTQATSVSTLPPSGASPPPPVAAPVPISSPAASTVPSSGLASVRGLVQQGCSPAAGIVVSIYYEGRYNEVLAKTVTDETGRYRFTGLPVGRLEAGLSPVPAPYSSYGTWNDGDGVGVTTLANAEVVHPGMFLIKSMVITAPTPGASLRAPITVTWDPVPGATSYRVSMTQVTTNVYSATTAETRHSIAVLPAGTYQLTVHANPQCETRAGSIATARRSISVQ